MVRFLLTEKAFRTLTTILNNVLRVDRYLEMSSDPVSGGVARKMSSLGVHGEEG